MTRLLAMLALAALMTLSGVERAEARWFEPQADWANAGALCAASREPAGRRWAALPPRACAAEAPAVREAAAPAAEVRVWAAKPVPAVRRELALAVRSKTPAKAAPSEA